MNSFHRAHLAGLVCLTGGMLQIIYGLLSIPFAFAQNNLGWDEALWALVTVGMIGGALGLLTLGVARPRWMALVGATLTILGCLIRIGVIPFNILSPSDVYVPFILISAFLIILGMGVPGNRYAPGEAVERLAGVDASASGRISAHSTSGLLDQSVYPLYPPRSLGSSLDPRRLRCPHERSQTEAGHAGPDVWSNRATIDAPAQLPGERCM